jgi:predicted PolB exonuclease-like 3'-5' exonuclease
MNVFVFDIETIPDVNTARKQNNFEMLSDEEVVSAITAQQRAQKGTDFLPLYMQRIVCISAVLRTPSRFMVWSLGDENSSEPELIERFFDGIEKYTPTLVSWNGSGFDLPVLHYRSLLHGISAPRYWENGETDSQFKYNNYLNRYHYRHLDLMDILASYNSRAYAPLDGIATLLDFPGKMGQSGSQVWPQFRDGKIQDIRNYCETDVLNTYLVYLRFQLLRGMFTKESFKKEVEFVKEALQDTEKAHLDEFVKRM